MISTASFLLRYVNLPRNSPAALDQYQEELDSLIKELSTNWALERMARVDVSLLRLGAFELLHRPETPVSVIINEAVEIGKRYGTKETPAFVNGILDKISRLHRPTIA